MGYSFPFSRGVKFFFSVFLLICPFFSTFFSLFFSLFTFFSSYFLFVLCFPLELLVRFFYFQSFLLFSLLFPFFFLKLIFLSLFSLLPPSIHVSGDSLLQLPSPFPPLFVQTYSSILFPSVPIPLSEASPTSLSLLRSSFCISLAGIRPSLFPSTLFSSLLPSTLISGTHTHKKRREREREREKDGWMNGKVKGK